MGFAQLACAAWDSMLNLLYPPACRICRGALPGHGEGNVCPACWGRVTVPSGRFCDHCGAPTEDGVMRGHCPNCPSGKPTFEKARFAGIYGGTLREAIHLFKFGYQEDLAEPLGKVLADGYERHYATDRFDLVIPVPLHWFRRYKREFNQSECLARVLCRERRLELSVGNLIRYRRTAPQSKVAGKHKAHNVKGAFRLRDPIFTDGKRILLVDDIYTSGSTVVECARVLSEQGHAASVCVLTLSRAV